MLRISVLSLALGLIIASNAYGQKVSKKYRYDGQVKKEYKLDKRAERLQVNRYFIERRQERSRESRPWFVIRGANSSSLLRVFVR